MSLSGAWRGEAATWLRWVDAGEFDPRPWMLDAARSGWLGILPLSAIKSSGSTSRRNLDDMPAAVREIGRVLRPGGRFCFVVVHPFDSSEPEQYFETRRYELTAGGVTFRNVHHPLESYTGAVDHGGMLIESVREPRIPAGPAELGLSEGWRRVPLALVVRALKAARRRKAS